MKAALITIGDEILSGNTIDTNSNFIAHQLRKIGIPVMQIFTISDEVEIIKKTLNSATEIADVIICTGGLGPTKDDRTKIAFAEFFNDTLEFNVEIYEHLRKYFVQRKREHLLEINRDQAVVLSKAVIFQNENGSAPCQMIRANEKIVMCLPGVPFEVKPLIKDKIIPFLAREFLLNHVVSRIISVVDFPESLLALTIENWEIGLPENMSLSYLPVGNRVKLSLTAKGTKSEALEKLLDSEILKLKPLIGEKVISWDGNDIQEILGEILTERKLSISTAESCTGGELSRLLTSVSGSSNYFLGGIITYDAQKKIEILGVQKSTIIAQTVVSSEVAQEMSFGGQKLFNTDICLSSTGIAGPNSDQFNSDIGEVYYSIRVQKFEKTTRLFLPHLERNDFINFVSQRILQDLVQILTTDKF